jgi:tetratricopeptide (TPR) repeat protein
MEIDGCEEDRPCKKRATGSERTCEQVSDIEAANFESNARRAKGSDRSSDQIAHVKTANSARAKGSDRSMDQIVKIKAANIVSNARRAKGNDRSLDQIAEVKAASIVSNARRTKGSDRSFKQVAAVKKSNKASPRSRRQIQQRKFWDRIINRQTVLEQRVSEGIGFMKVYDYERAYVVIQSAIELIPSREKYVRSEMIGYYNAHYLFGSCLRELGDLQGAIKSLQEADILANIQHQEIPLFGKPNEVLIPLSKSKV